MSQPIQTVTATANFTVNPDVLGVVLAGGQSRRMGVNKATLTIHQTSLLNYTANKLKDAGVRRVKISGELNCPPFESFADVITNKGPLGGLYSAFCHYEFSGALFVPVDLPLITAQSLSKLIIHGQNNNTACYFANSNLPLYLPYCTETQQFIKSTLIEGKKLSIESLIQFTQAQSIDDIDAIELTNTNTPQEWATVTQRVS